jgi:hypothetical protein
MPTMPTRKGAGSASDRDINSGDWAPFGNLPAFDRLLHSTFALGMLKSPLDCYPGSDYT